MTHDYQKYEDADVESLQYRIGCEDCDWVNRRTFENTAQNSKRSHENRHPSHTVTVEQDGGPFDTEDADE